MLQQGHRWEGAGTSGLWQWRERRAAPEDGRPLIYPPFYRLPPPVIVIGMHRSGTSLVAAMLATLGVFMGPEACFDAEAERRGVSEAWMLNGYGEAADFRNLNDGLLSRAGAAWDGIEAFLARRECTRFAAASVRRLQWATFGCLRRRYLGFLAGGSPGSWGWKDPRNSLTLPYWLQLFPGARILHVRRDPEAVADSLHRRAQIWNRASGPPLPWDQRARQWVLHPTTTLRRAGRRLGIGRRSVPSDPCLDRDYCRSLSQQYVRECLRYRAWGERYLEVCYEGILDHPLVAAGELAQFVGRAAARDRLVRASEIVRPREPPARARSAYRDRER